jgi:hypothetical protein
MPNFPNSCFAICRMERLRFSAEQAFDDAGCWRRASRRPVSDGRWHHVLAELDRKQSRMSIYLDGELDAFVKIGPQPNLQGSLANDADLYLGGTTQGNDLNGAIDFVRIARGTLAYSKTTIQELYAWEFQGPFLEDFAGRQREAGAAAGALAK